MAYMPVIPQEGEIKTPETAPVAQPSIEHKMVYVEGEPLPDGIFETQPAAKTETPAAPEAPKPLPPPEAPPDEAQQAIGKIFQAHLADAFQELEPLARPVFDTKAEETARAVRVLLEAPKVDSEKIYQTIYGWLQILPNTNNAFLVQEAWLKTQAVLALRTQPS